MDEVEPSRHLDGQTRRILERLMLAGGRPVTLRALVSYLYPAREPSSSENVIRQAIYKARLALPKGAITHLRGLGYKIHVKVKLPEIDSRTFDELRKEQKDAS